MEYVSLLPSDLKHIDITGGEPTLLKEKLPYLIEKALVQSENAEIRMLSNGRSFAADGYTRMFQEFSGQKFKIEIPVHSANREKHETNSFYGSRIEKSITKMEKDERNGTDPLKVAKVVYKVIKSKNPKTMIAIGANYKMFVFIKKILPIKFVQYVLYKIYG
mgnify:CR=1 FL=1